jgi:four helix bundle protein
VGTPGASRVGMAIGNTLKRRTFDFSVAVFRACRPIMRTPEARVPVGQLVRASASVAANYRASCRAKSKRDFIAKMGTVIEEADESLFWLEYLVATALVAGQTVKKLQSESNELVAIFTTSQKTARANYAREKNRRRALRRRQTRGEAS